MSEAPMTINGQVLSEAQSMTVRVALNAFISDLRENGLGDDEHGKRMTAAYCERAAEVLQMIMRPSVSQANRGDA